MLGAFLCCVLNLRSGVWGTQSHTLDLRFGLFASAARLVLLGSRSCLREHNTDGYCALAAFWLRFGCVLKLEAKSCLEHDLGLRFGPLRERMFFSSVEGLDLRQSFLCVLKLRSGRVLKPILTPLSQYGCVLKLRFGAALVQFSEIRF